MQYKYPVTIGIPIYGVEKYIEKCLTSVLNQTFEDDIEVILVDDLGKDRSIDIAKQIIKNHPKGKNARILTQPQNMGPAAARNRIIQEASGKYLFFLDADDYIAQETISLMYETAEKYQTDAVYGSVESVNEAGHAVSFSIGDMHLPYLELLNEDKLASYANKNLHATLYNFVYNILISTHFLRYHGLRFHDTRICEDFLFNSEMQPLIQRAVLLPDITYYYVIRGGSLSNYQNRETIPLQNIEEYFSTYKKIKEQARCLKEKSYYETRCAKMMIATLYVVCGALKNRHKIRPALTDKDIHDAIQHPVRLKEILHFRKHRIVNICFSLIGKMPPKAAVWCYLIIGKTKKLL